MPLFKNNELLKENERDNEWVTKELKRLKEIDSIQIKTTQNIVLSEPGEDGKRRPYPLPNTMWPLMGKRINEKGYDEEWRYSRNIPKKDEHGNYQWGGQNGIAVMFENGQLILEPKRNQHSAELAFFLLNISSVVKSGKFKLVDLERDAEEEGKILGEQSALTFYLFNENSPYNKDKEGEERLRYVAASWGVQNSDLLSMPILRVRLRDTIITSQANISTTNRGISDFVYEIANNDKYTEYRRLHQLAIDKNVYGFNFQQNAWCYKNAETGEFADFIVSVLPTQMEGKDKVMVEHMRSTPKCYDLVKEIVEGYNVHGNTRYAHIKNWGEFKSFCAKRGIDTKGKTRVELEKELLDQDSSQ